MRESSYYLDGVFGRAKMETLDLYRNLAQANGLFVESAADISANVRPTFGGGARTPRSIGSKSWS